jgi:hypothetical protein
MIHLALWIASALFLLIVGYYILTAGLAFVWFVIEMLVEGFKSSYRGLKAQAAATPEMRAIARTKSGPFLYGMLASALIFSVGIVTYCILTEPPPEPKHKPTFVPDKPFDPDEYLRKKKEESENKAWTPPESDRVVPKK